MRGQFYARVSMTAGHAGESLHLNAHIRICRNRKRELTTSALAQTRQSECACPRNAMMLPAVPCADRCSPLTREKTIDTDDDHNCFKHFAFAGGGGFFLRRR
jgi:hypothetical protein